MNRVRFAVGFACVSLFGASVFVSTAAAAPGTYTFYDCVGPSGTPTTFTATKTALPAASPNAVSAAGAFHLTDGSSIFVVLSFGEGNFSPPGIGVSGIANVTCMVSTTDGVFAFSGFLAPAP